MKRTLKCLLACTMLALQLTGCASPPGASIGSDCTSTPRLVPGASLFGCDLAGLDFSGLDLTGADFHGANLANSNLQGANLTSANFEGANLSGANLTDANLTGAILSGAILVGALFINALLGHAVFDFGATFGGSGGGVASGGGNCTPSTQGCPGYNEANTNFEDYICNPDLGQVVGDPELFITRTHEQLVAVGARSVVTDSATDFTGAIFDYTWDEPSALLLRGISFSKANFTNAVFKGAIFACNNANNGRFNGAQFIPGHRNGEFHHMDLKNASFNGARFLNQSFCDVDMSGSSFVNAHISASGHGCAEMIPQAVLLLLPNDLLRLRNTDFTDAIFGYEPLPDLPDGTIGGEIGNRLGGSYIGAAFWTDFTGANFTNVTMVDTLLPGAVLSDTTATGLSSSGIQDWQDVTFPPNWASTTWSGTANLQGATCPDFSSASATNTCFPGLAWGEP